MEEIKVGDYIRTKQWGIAKVNMINNGKCIQIKNRNNRLTSYFEQIGKTSPNIIDVIDVGDYVNGFIVTSVHIDSCNKKKKISTDTEIQDDWGNRRVIEFYNEEINSIVTKEQFNSIKYEVI